MALKSNELAVYLDVKVENIGPLHIGNGEEEILIDTYTNKSYIPATSIAGAIKAYLNDVNEIKVVEKYWGSLNAASRVCVYDTLIDETLIETRPGLKIDEKTGAKTNTAYFKTEYLKSGCVFNLRFEAFIKHEEEKEFEMLVRQMFQGIDQGIIRLGGKKTAGGGALKIKIAQMAILNLKDKKELVDYVNQDIQKHYKPFEFKNSFKERGIICFHLKCHTKTPLLIKGLSVQNYLEADARPIKNGEDKYIIPGSSLKGVMRSGSRKITHLFKQEQLVTDLFGNEAGEKDEQRQKIGKVFFKDVKIENTKLVKLNRIKIDRFKGGVMSSALMDEETIQGELDIQILMKRNSPEELLVEEEKEIALLAFLLRDIGTGTLRLGSGQGIGRGKLVGSTLTISGLEQEIQLDLCEMQNSRNIHTLNAFCKQLMGEGE